MSVNSQRFTTAGEQLVGHKLMATREHGVPHYVPGQHRAGLANDSDILAELDTDDMVLAAELSYVDEMGHAVLVICAKEPEDSGWRPLMVGRAGHSYFQGWRLVGSGEGELEFALSDRMKAALRKAEEEDAA